MKIFYMILIPVLLFQIASAEKFSLKRLGYKHYSVQHPSLGKINYYVSLNQIDKRKPILLYLDGSGASPLFQYTNNGLASTVPFDAKKTSNTFHVVLISKPGVPFLDSMQHDEQGRPHYPAPLEYDKKLSLDWRTQAAKTTLENVLSTLETNKVISIIGISEGFQVGAKLIEQYDKISNAALLVGNGLSQFYDFIIHNRMLEQKEKISSDLAQQNIDSLLTTFKDIYRYPNSTQKKWYGHTYLRWSSFAKNSPMENILSSDIPIYLVGCSKDVNTSVLSTDYLFLEATRRKKNNILYKVLPYDHFFNEIIKDENGNISAKKSHIHEEIDSALQWLASQ